MTSRVQLALNVTDLDAAIDHYRKMFDTEPHKIRPGYANFAIADPPMKLVLFEHPDHEHSLNHLGVEVTDEQAVAAVAERFNKAGLESRSSSAEVCCHAEQTKVYVEAPDAPLGMWEFYAVTDDDPGDATPSGVCCATDAGAVTGGGCCE